MDSEEEEQEDFLEPLSHSFDAPYSVMSLFSKMPLEESEEQEGLSSIPGAAFPSILNLYTAAMPNKAIEPNSILEDYESIESDLFYEASHLLQLAKVSLPWESRMAALARLEDRTDGRYRHLHLYNFIALSLVRKFKGDVCAVTVYQSHTAIEVYYAKNSSRQEDAEKILDNIHASSLKKIVRAAAKSKITEQEFRTQYFDTVFRNCKGKLSRRVSAVITACSSPPPHSNASSAVEEVRSIISMAYLPNKAENEADIQAVQLAEMNNLPQAVFFVLSVLIKCLGTIPQRWDPTTFKNELDLSSCESEQIHDLSLLSWISGQSSTFKYILSRTRSPSIAKLISSLRKLGTYYRGIDLLYAAVMDSQLNRKYQALCIRRVTAPEVVTPHLYPEWYKAMDVIYYRHRGRGMLVSPSAVVSAYPALNRYYDSSSQTFVRHAEVRLVDYLTFFKRRPSEIGVSKLCCRGCYVWLARVNNKLLQGGGVSLWTVSGTHGKNYPWAKDSTSRHSEAEQSVVNDVYDQVAKLLDSIHRLKTDPDAKSETGQTQQVPIHAADSFKQPHKDIRGELRI